MLVRRKNLNYYINFYGELKCFSYFTVESVKAIRRTKQIYFHFINYKIYCTL